LKKFPQADPTLTTQMKSVGEAMAIGRTSRKPAKMPALAGDRQKADSAATANPGASARKSMATATSSARRHQPQAERAQCRRIFFIRPPARRLQHRGDFQPHENLDSLDGAGGAEVDQRKLPSGRRAGRSPV